MKEPSASGRGESPEDPAMRDTVISATGLAPVGADDAGAGPQEAESREVAHARPPVDGIARDVALAAAQRGLELDIDTPPPRLGQYYLLDKLGAGAMGVVYGAYDPDLDRKVALKLLHTGPEDSQGRQRLQREARALARLNHANVVTVHGVGVQDGQPWVAMEFVPGRNVADWLAESERSVDEVLDVFVSAARGLAAAHSAGVVHRDFKPANVMIGEDGTARVADFGLARPTDTADTNPDAEPGGSISGSGSWGDSLTQTRGVVGTPAYMAPEQYVTSDVGPPADQYAFCVSLYEGLHGKPPFAGRDLMGLVEAKTSGTLPALPTDTRVPRWLHKVLARGLQPDADARWPDMQALIDALESGRSAAGRRRHWPLWLAAAGAAGLATAFFATEEHDAAPGDGCENVAAPIEAQWVDRKDELRRAVEGTKLPYAASTWTWVSRALDDYAQSWSQGRAEVCRGEAQGTMTPLAVQRRLECLELSRAKAAAVIDLLAQSDDQILEAADELVAGIDDPTHCLGESTLRAFHYRPVTAQGRERGDALIGVIARVHALRLAGKRKEAKADQESVREQITDDLEPYVRAEAYRMLALAHPKTHPEHERLLREAWRDSVRAHADRLATMVLYDLGMMELQRARPKVATIFIEHGLAVLDRIDETARRNEFEDAFTPVMRSPFEGLLGAAYRAQGRHEEGMATLLRAAQLAPQAGPRYAFKQIEAYNNYAEALRETGRYEEALPYYDRAIELGTEVYDEHHPTVSTVLNNRAAGLMDLGLYARARADFERARADAVARFGETNASVAILDYNLGVMDINTGDFGSAQTRLESARTAWQKTLRSDHPYPAFAQMSLGTLAREQDEPAQAVELAAQARTTLRRAFGKTPSLLVATADTEYALALVMAKRLDDAQGPLDQARQGMEAIDGMRTPPAAAVHVAEGELALARGDDVAANAAFSAAIEILDTHVSPTHPELSWPLLRRAQLHRRANDSKRARADLQRAEAVRSKLGWPPRAARLRTELQAAVGG